MVSASKTGVSSSTLSVAVQSKDGDLVASEVDSEAVDIRKLCQLGLQELVEASLLRLDPEASVVVSAADLVVVLAVAAFEEVSEVVTEAATAVEEAVLDTKAAAVLVAEEVGTAVGLPMATVVAKQHPRMRLLAPEATAEALAVGMVALP